MLSDKEGSRWTFGSPWEGERIDSVCGLEVGEDGNRREGCGVRVLREPVRDNWNSTNRVEVEI